MTDKMRRTAPLQITFGDGEMPDPAKLNALNNQVRTSTDLLERAIGDLWNLSGDSLLVNYPLQIPNLARTIGESKYLNPALFWLTNSFTYRDFIGTNFVNQNEGFLRFQPDTFASVVAVTGSTNLTDKKTNEYDIANAGDWWIDSTTGRFRSFSALSTADKLEYTVDPDDWNLSDFTLPGVIPDPRQTRFAGCRVSQTGSTFYLHLPPRQPLDDLYGTWDLPDKYPPSTEWTQNKTGTAGDTKRFWQSESQNAFVSGDLAYDTFFRYSLPKEILNSSVAVGAAYPKGFLYLWDEDQGTIIYDVVFKKTAYPWILEISSSTYYFDDKVSTSEAEANYTGTAFKLIAVGSPLARSLHTLSNAFYNHQHNNLGDMSPIISHSNLLDQNPPISTHASHGGTYPSTVPAWSPSRWYADHHVSLLSRVGSQGSGAATSRDVNDNAMLGPLVMASTTMIGSNYLNSTGASHPIYFGYSGSPVYLYSEAGGGFLGCHAVLHITTSSAATAALRIDAQATPTAYHTIGSLYVTAAGVLKICTAAGTPGVWVSVGSQT